MDVATGDIRAVEFTSSGEGDSPVLPNLLAQIPADQPIGTVTADGAYDTRTCQSAIAGRGGTAVIPIRKNGRPWKEDCPAARARNETLRTTRHFGRAFWKRLTGTTPEVAWRRRGAASKPSENASPHETPTAKPPRSTPASHS
jgi:hypothetical protein